MMRCPKCERLPSSVLKTERPVDEGMDNVKRRRRVCRNCRYFFYTYEIPEEAFRKLCPKDPNAVEPVPDKIRTPLRTKKRSDTSSQ